MRWLLLALLLVVLAYALFAIGPPSLRAAYKRAVTARIAETVAMPPLTEADLAPLPEPVRRYVRATGSVGQPRVHHFEARWRGRIRSGPDDPWMTFHAKQVNVIGEPARIFFMDARRGGLPVDVLHAYEGGAARMRVRLLSLVPLVDEAGPELDKTETVTVFNDMSILAPAALVEPSISWEPIDDRSARGSYTVGSHTVSATLHFNDAGELVDFVSDDRSRANADGSLEQVRWSTPVGDYRAFGERRVATRGEGRWHPPDGAYAYIELELEALETNGTP